MTEHQRKQFESQLRRLRLRLRRDVSALAEQSRRPTGGQADGGLSNTPMHLADLGSDAFDQGMDATLLQNEEYLSNEVDAAIRRLHDGPFGRCERCEGDIDLARLEALPYARLCMQCAREESSGPELNLNAGQLASPDDTIAGTEAAAESDKSGAPDSHASGTVGGGTSIRGLAGTNVDRGSPSEANLEAATSSGAFDATEGPAEADAPRAGKAGGAVGGSPARKRAPTK